ncbi:response regulator transcription factor [Rhodanobacter sp. 7MK24]|uniref:response regulator n=1 Tax=Rhodanobacter sp. 7MK24 TaxID=2775922 RepID=UPI00177AC58B|nr:response regulator transcription factor [Rhodanobacter sp. 7MK24]MBD8880360.1 response regulator transcription factor [Rhodanobacter sp. 7MK24]
MTDTNPPAADPLPAPVLIVEDEPLLQQRLHRVLVGLGYAADAVMSAASLAQARACLAVRPAALVLLDLKLPDGNGLALMPELRAQDPQPAVLVVSGWSAEDAILDAFRAGATGYVLKGRDDAEVSFSIRNVLRGGVSIDPFIARRILDLLPPPKPVAAPAPAADALLEETLTKREAEILRRVAGGLTNREIAEQLAISRHTVNDHVKGIYRKLMVSTRMGAVGAARSRGFLA